MRDFFRRNAFFLRRLHSLTGVIPTGGFLIFHLFANYSARIDPHRFEAEAKWINELPFVWALEVFLIILPLYFHALYGIYIAMDAKYSGVARPFGRQWPFFWQRVTGIITLVFVTYHLWHFRLQKLLGVIATEGFPKFTEVQAGLANPVVAAFYALGTVAAVYHLTNGLYTFLITWGITIGPRSQRITNAVCNVLFVGVSALGLAALAAFR